MKEYQYAIRHILIGLTNKRTGIGTHLTNDLKGLLLAVVAVLCSNL